MNMTHRVVQLVFTRRRGVVPRLIRFFTWSDWSHVGIVFDGKIIESVAGIGVREVALAQAIPKGTDFQILSYRCDDPAAVIAAARTQIGKPYDNSAIFGFIGRRDWQKPDSWFCSELVAWAFAHAGFALFRPDSVHRVTPGDLWMLAQGIAPEPTN
jgi:uncharacterized protein YycO